MSYANTGASGFAGRRGAEEEYVRAQRLRREATSRWTSAVGDHGPGTGCGARNVGETDRVVSVVSGLGLAAVGFIQGRWTGLLLGGFGAGLMWRGLTGHCPCYAALGINTTQHNRAVGVPAQQGEKVERTITIGRTPGSLYQFWRHLENLPRVMSHLKEVRQLDPRHSRWVAQGPLGEELEWDAEIWNEREDELIAWRSLPGGDIDTAGSVHFKPSAQPGCCEVTVSMKYNPPAGKLGVRIADWLGEGLGVKIENDLRQFKQEMESNAPVSPMADRGAVLGQ